MTSEAVATTGPVRVVGTGLLGTSIGLALTARGVPVQLVDASPANLALARDLGAGEPVADGAPAPALVVVAAPPDVTAGLVGSALHSFPEAIVTDVASVKAEILTQLRRFATVDLTRYVGSHPMAGRERGGAVSADADLFAGKPWVLTPHEDSQPRALLMVRDLAADLGASTQVMPAAEHDRAVALVSHLPQLMSSLTAARLVEASPEALALTGAGLRDLTRVAASNPTLWASILAGNATAVRDALRAVRDDVDSLLAALDRASTDGPLAFGALAGLAAVLSAGNDGAARIPGKHGEAPRRYQDVVVLVPDEPGALGRLFAEIGEEGVNVEDLSLEHSPNQKVGLARVSVIPPQARDLEQQLEARGWRVVRESS